MASELIRAVPAAAGPLAGPILENYDMPGAKEIAAKIEALQAPAQIPDEVKQGIQQMQQQGQQLTQQLQQAQAQMQELANENAALKQKNDIEARKTEIAAYEAETHRLIAMKPDQVRDTAA